MVAASNADQSQDGTSTETVDGDSSLPAATSSQVSDGESSEDDDVSEQSGRPDEVEFLATDGEPRS
ncbi:hypothetical protein OESDEN_24488 [Oesophagostomum dentatum]|uniref:Uncharacterized protein n=1 Tax=Oesophagostomum dentatum TaxID=61180 RepID=A0A0B1RT99_OESDE|nr:hypothetical protein OESDEN_24488 [Oesophagostomum dentatum]